MRFGQDGNGLFKSLDDPSPCNHSIFWRMPKYGWMKTLLGRFVF